MTYLVALRKVLFSIVAFAALLLVAPTTAFSQTISTTPVNVPGLCNSVSFHQIPGNGNYFIGRRLINTTTRLLRFQLDTFLISDGLVLAHAQPHKRCDQSSGCPDRSECHHYLGI